MKNPIWIIWLVLCLSACGSHTPDYVISEKDMEDLLVDIHKSEAVIESNYNIYNNNADKKKIREAVFLRHGVTQEQFDTTLVWYGHHIETYMKIYDRVVERLKAENEEAKKLLAEENSQTMSQPGDSVDVWKQRRSHIFDSRLSTNLLAFDIAPDENFRTRDYFELKFKVVMLPKLSVNPQVYMAVRHTDNGVAYNRSDIDKGGWFSLPLQSDSATALSRLYGYIVLPEQSVREKVYIDSLMLIRKHYNDRIPDVDNQVYMPEQSVVSGESKKAVAKRVTKLKKLGS